MSPGDVARESWRGLCADDRSGDRSQALDRSGPVPDVQADTIVTFTPKDANQMLRPGQKIAVHFEVKGSTAPPDDAKNYAPAAPQLTSRKGLRDPPKGKRAPFGRRVFQIM